MENILFALSPLLVTLIIQTVKKFGVIRFNDFRVSIIRFLVFLFAFISTVLASFIGEGEVDFSLVPSMVDTGVVAFMAMATHLFTKLKKNSKI